jgi:hypothetical protein
MSHAVDKQHLHELISVYATNLESKIAELEESNKTLMQRATDLGRELWLINQSKAGE